MLDWCVSQCWLLVVYRELQQLHLYITCSAEDGLLETLRSMRETCAQRAT
jgi:hypothetical protein